MPVLSNPRQERFAQALANGKSQQEAYVIAGYNAHASNPSKLAKDKRVVARVAELADARNKMSAIASEKAAEALLIDKKWIMSRLVENADRAMQAVEVKDHKGIGTGEYRYEGSVANRALELLGKELGMFIDRREVGGPGDFDDASEDDLREFIANETAEIGERATKH